MKRLLSIFPKNWLTTAVCATLAALSLLIIPAVRASADSYISGFMRDAAGNLDVTIKNSSGTSATISSGSDGLSNNIQTLFSSNYDYGFNGTTWDRLRTTSAIQGTAAGMLAVGICNPGIAATPCAQTAVPNADALTSSANTLQVMSYLYGFNGTTYDRLRTQCDGTGVLCVGLPGSFNNSISNGLNVSTGGNTQSKVTATTCTNLTGPDYIHRFWSSGTETATLSIYNEGASPTCAAADLIWSGTPTTTPITLEAFESVGISYKLSAAPAANDYITSN